MYNKHFSEGTDPATVKTKLTLTVFILQLKEQGNWKGEKYLIYLKDADYQSVTYISSI